jgi:cytochrome P450
MSTGADTVAPEVSEAIRALTTDAGIADPYPLYATLREHSPVYGLVDYPVGTIPGQDEPITAWAVLSYEQVVAALKDYETFSSRDPLQEASDMPSAMLGHDDPPIHTVHRKIANKVFTRGRVQALRPWLEERVSAMVGGLPVGEEVDVVEGLCGAIPGLAMTRVFGTPDADAPRYRKWAQGFMLSASLTPEERMASTMEMAGYFVEVLGERAAAIEKGDPPRNDLVDALLLTEESQRKFSFDEVLRFCISLLAAGAETTMYFIGNLFDALVEQPEAAEQVRQDRSLVGPFLNESMRVSGPAQRLFRIATRDTEIAGKPIREGEWVAIFYGAANHDPAVFPDPQSFRLDRLNGGKHVAFGQGIHYCLGAPLALLLGEVVINTVLDRFARIERGATAPMPQTATLLQHGFTSLPVVLHLS